MATRPVDELNIIERFGPHLARCAASGFRHRRARSPGTTHCCFCGQQCGIQLKVKDNEVIGFEPWEEFPFNRGNALPEGRQALPAGRAPRSAAHGAAARRAAPADSAPSPTTQAIRRVASEIQRIQSAYGPDAFARARRREPDHREDVPDGKVRPRVPEDAIHRLQRPAVHGERRRRQQEGVRHRPGANPWRDMLGAEVIWVAGANIAECAPITTNYIWQAREQRREDHRAVDPRMTPIARTCDLFLPVQARARRRRCSTACCT